MSEDSVGLLIEGTVAVLSLNNPPVNALSHHLRLSLQDKLERVAKDEAIQAVVIAGEGKSLCAGADIREFNKPPQAPRTNDILKTIDSFAKPVVAVIHGPTLGGGLELALASHARVAAPNAELGLPEVKLGLIPGAGGTQRLPRIVGPAQALDIIISARRLSAEDAHQVGLVEEVAGDARAAAIGLARRLAEGSFDRADRFTAELDRAAFDAAAKKHLARARGSDAIAAAIESIGNVFSLTLDEGLEREQEIFQRLRAGDQSKAMRHLFFAERSAAKVQGAAEVVPQEIRHVSVLGAGTMGGGIAMCFADAGIPVLLMDENESALAQGLARIRKNYEISASRGRLSDQEVEERMALIEGTEDMQRADQSDLVIEAVFEDMSLKQKLFARLDGIAKSGALLATNTSSLDIDRIAEATQRPEAVLGLHFFSPANVMRLLEIVRGAKTARESLVTATTLASRIDKVPVIVGNCPGFVGNRILRARHMQAERLLEEGATPKQVDDALLSFGFPMGPFAMNDLAGLDVGERVRRAQGYRLPVADALCAKGWYGQKTGRGFFRYEEGSRKPLPDPEVEALVREVAAELGVTQREFSEADIIERLLFPMINEGARVLEEGMARHPADIDVVYVHGYGFPAWRGGLMYYADKTGLGTIAERLRRFAEESGDDTLRPAPLLAALASENSSFSTWADQHAPDKQ